MKSPKELDMESPGYLLPGLYTLYQPIFSLAIECIVKFSTVNLPEINIPSNLRAMANPFIRNSNLIYTIPVSKS